MAPKYTTVGRGSGTGPGTAQPREEEGLGPKNGAPKLRLHGLWFVGLDLIGGKLIEVNVTSPTGLQQLARFAGRPVEQDVIVWVEKRVGG